MAVAAPQPGVPYAGDAPGVERRGQLQAEHQQGAQRHLQAERADLQRHHRLGRDTATLKPRKAVKTSAGGNAKARPSR